MKKKKIVYISLNVMDVKQTINDFVIQCANFIYTNKL